jgi:hypothetical protein
MFQLSPIEARVIGSLAEKQLTTPQQYPLTANALVQACNQSSNRDPVVSYDEAAVEEALSSLKDAHLLRFVYPSHGRSATRYRQVIDEYLHLTPRSLAVLAVLLLRGPQTVGELRARTERMADFSSLSDLEAELSAMSSLPDPLVSRQPRQPGQKEERWAQLLAGDHGEVATSADARSAISAPTPSGALRDEVASLRAEVGALRDELGFLKVELDELRADLGS